MRRCLAMIGSVTVMTAMQATTWAEQRLSWQHGDSPYRAIFHVVQEPTVRDAGIALAVPVCGLAGNEYRDLYAYDGSGNQLQLFLLGKGTENTVLVLVKGNVPVQDVAVYFGSGGRAPMVNKGFLPGLTIDVRTLPEGNAATWQDVSGLLAKSTRIGMCFADKIEQAYNPADSSDACLLVFDGYLQIERPGPQTLMIVSDDAGYLLIDDDLVLCRDGRHYAHDAVQGECRKEIQFTAGPHKVRFVLVDFGGDMMAVLARWVSDRQKTVLPAEAYLRSGKTRLLAVEARYRDAPLPVFTSEAQSYMSYNGAQYTEVRFEAVNGADSLWRFEDGGMLRGPSCTRVFPGLETRGVACTQGKATGQGVVALSEVPPKQLYMTSAADVERYTKLILDLDLSKLDPTTLRGYVTFLEYQPLNPALIPVCDAIAGNSKASKRIRLDALLDLGRVAARTDPEKAKKAYSMLIKEQTGDTWAHTAREAAEVALFALRDFGWAEDVITRLARAAGKNDKVVMGLRLDLTLQRGEEEKARENVAALLSGTEFGEKQRYSVVQGNALRQRFYDLLAEGFPFLAWDVLHEWSQIAPLDRVNGSFGLARSQLWRTFGWLDGALGELDGAMLLDPLLPNLPDVELERAKTMAEAGDSQHANELFMKIIKEYPNHPAANAAKRRIR